MFQSSTLVGVVILLVALSIGLATGVVWTCWTTPWRTSSTKYSQVRTYKKPGFERKHDLPKHPHSCIMWISPSGYNLRLMPV